MRALTLEHLLAALSRPSHQLVETSRGLRLRRPRYADAALRRAVAEHAGALRVAARLDAVDPVRSPARRAEWGVAEWGDVTALHARWLAHLFAPPLVPVDVRPGIWIVDWDRYRASVAERYAAGPSGPYADDLRLELAGLFERFAAPLPVARPEVPAFARAA